MRRRVLIVDDDRSMVDTLCDILALRGWETLRAHDGVAATEIASSEPVDIVVMDVRMPRMDGVTALRAIRSRRPAVRVILMTAFAAADLLADAEQDALRILKKPVDVTELLSLLEAAFRRARCVLIVDDDPEALRTLSEVLAANGLETSQVRTLPDALALLARDQPGVVLLDLKLNGADAAEHLDEFRKLSPSVLLVLYSGYAAELADAVRRAPSGLVAAAFTKPVAIARLLEVIDAA